MKTVAQIVQELTHLGCSLNILVGKSAINECCVCDNIGLSTQFEAQTLEVMQDITSIYGFFIYNSDGKHIASALINLHPAIETVNLHTEEIIHLHHFEPDLVAERVFICTNQLYRIPGIGQLLVQLIEAFALANDKQYIILIAAEKDERAKRFHQMSGYKPSLKRGYMIKELSSLLKAQKEEENIHFIDEMNQQKSKKRRRT